MSNTPEKPDSSAIVHSLIPPDWDNGPYNVASELKRLLASVSDYGISIDSGTMDGQAHLWVTIGGIEYFITVERASGQSKRSLCLEEIDRLRLALETAADRMFDAGLNDAWADARAALKEEGDE